MRERAHLALEESFWLEQIGALRGEIQFRHRQEIASFRFRLAELSILAATATAALVAIRWRERGLGRYLSATAAVAFFLVCLAEIVLVWRAAEGNEKLQGWCRWDTIGPVVFVAGLVLGILGVILIV